MEHFDGGFGAAFAWYPDWLRANLVEYHVVTSLGRLWFAVRGEHGDVVLLLDAHDFDVQWRHLPLQAYLADGRNVVDQVEFGYSGVVEKNMEVAIVNDPTNVEQFLSDRMLNFFQLAHDVKIGVLFHKILHRLVYFILRVVLRILLQIFVGHARNHVFNISV